MSIATLLKKRSLTFCFHFMLLMCFYVYQAFAAHDNAIYLDKEKDQEAAKIEILVVPAVIDELDSFLGGESIIQIKNFNRPGSRRDMVDYILLYKALVLGGISPSEIKISPWEGISYNRVLSRLSDGDAAVFSNTIWREDVSKEYTDLYVTNPTLRFGEYVAGMYMNPDNPKFKQDVDWNQLTAVSSKQWKPDWNALSQLPLKHLYSAVNWEGMFRMVHNQRADFMLIPFSRENDLSYSAIGLTLKPKPGIKVELAGSRGWAVSKTHSRGGSAKKAIEIGLKKLREQGVIIEAYRAAGVINDKVELWVTAHHGLLKKNDTASNND